MFEYLGLQKTSPSKPTKQHRRILYLIWVFMLLIGSMGHTAPVSAAPPVVETIVDLLVHVWLPKGPICVGSDSRVTVKVVKTNEVTVDGVIIMSDSIAMGSNLQAVDGSVEDPGIGTLDPPKTYTGFKLRGGGPGEAIFIFHANKVGSTKLYFKVDIKEYDKYGPIHKIIDQEKDIKVVKCDYKVFMHYSGVASGGGFTVIEIGLMQAR